jgi:integral membrane protein (TIGR01906 family)
MKTLYAVLSVLVAIILPFFILMTSIRLLINPVYPQVEYNMPWFPQDPFGFDKQDRLYYSRFAIDYLLNSADISYLSTETFPDSSPLYNERELSHMVDVKNLVQAMIKAWWILLIVLLGLGIWAWRGKWASQFWRGVSAGGWATIGLMFLILLSTMIDFTALFTAFHEIFFTGSSWIFLFSDTLIRLFPMTFWRDGFIMMGGFSILAALLSIFGGRALARRSA